MISLIIMIRIIRIIRISTSIYLKIRYQKGDIQSLCINDAAVDKNAVRR